MNVREKEMLTHQVEFKAAIQRGLRLQIPVLIRWRFKLEPGEVFSVYLGLSESIHSEEFYGRMSRDGRLTIPRRIARQFLEEGETLDALEGYTAEVTLYPVLEKEERKISRELERQVRDRDRGSDFKLRRI